VVCTYTVNQTCLWHIPIQVEREILQTLVCQGVKVKSLRTDLGGYQSSRVDEPDNGLFECFFFTELGEGSEVGAKEGLVEEACLQRWNISTSSQDVGRCRF
jgi:hypothetical protein